MTDAEKAELIARIIALHQRALALEIEAEALTDEADRLTKDAGLSYSNNILPVLAALAPQKAQ